MEVFVMRWMELESVIQSEVSQEISIFKQYGGFSEAKHRTTI